jgi:DNA-binding NarL/FixJ family response regulator
MTGQPTLSTAVRALHGQVVDYLVKPISPETLIARLDHTIARQRALVTLLEGQRRLESLVEAVEAAKAAVGLGGVTRSEQQLAPPAAREQDPLAGLAREELERLSPRERDVVRLLALGRPVQEVAATLKLSANTVRNHIKSVFAKLRVNSQVALLAKVAGHACTGPGSRTRA